MIVTDIKIPYINGIELAKKVREVYPLVKIIIITGYSEFEYAKEAANLGVIGLVSKPITGENIRELLLKAQATLDEEFLTQSNQALLNNFYQENLPIIRENDLYRLSKMSKVSISFEARLRAGNVDVNYPYFAICMFDFDELQNDDSERYDLVFSSIRKSVGEELCNFIDFEIFSRHEKLCLILKSHKEPSVSELERRIERIVGRAGRFSEMPLSAGISNIYHNNKNFSAMVKEAMRALEYRKVMGGGKVFSFSNAPSSAGQFIMDENLIKELGYILHSQTVEDCMQRIDIIRESLKNSGNPLYYAATGILNVLVRNCDDVEKLYAQNGGADMLYRKLFEIKTDNEMYDYLKTLVRQIYELNDNVIVDNVEKNLRLVTSYMEAHFCDPDLSFDSLSKAVNFSISYISILLKKRLNTSFVKMLTDLRMEKAKELLRNPSLKIIDIAEQLGYNDSYYFSHCFKKHIGMPPKDYRGSL